MLPQEQYMTIAGIFGVITLLLLEFFSSIEVMFLSLSEKRSIELTDTDILHSSGWFRMVLEL